MPKQSKVAPGVSKFLHSKTLSSFMVALFELYFASVKTKQMVNVRLNMIQYTRTYMRIRTYRRAQKTKTKGDIFSLWAGCRIRLFCVKTTITMKRFRTLFWHCILRGNVWSKLNWSDRGRKQYLPVDSRTQLVNKYKLENTPPSPRSMLVRGKIRKRLREKGWKWKWRKEEN